MERTAARWDECSGSLDFSTPFGWSACCFLCFPFVLRLLLDSPLLLRCCEDDDDDDVDVDDADDAAADDNDTDADDVGDGTVTVAVTFV